MPSRLIQLADGTRLAFDMSGPADAPVIVLLHALGERATSWDGVRAGLEARFRVVTLDLRGHGESDWPGVYSFELMRDDVVAFLKQMDLADVTLIGHSMGGVVAFLVALAMPARVSRLVLEDVVPPFPRTRATPERPGGELPFDWEVVPAIAQEVNDPERRYWPGLAKLQMPTLVVGGGSGSHIPQSLLAEATELLQDGTLVTVGGGHFVHVARPEGFTGAVLSWIDRTN
ncbi:alpha/beta hydrolase [Micromonospora phytophila]|uniref:alpha/beta fold hydrolase n=1 Tax=Micromonospora phytophila TaxID=709888 RepID=UPI00202E8071|nr:alpha/beta hydrolase [Micromonospora phytophila]MCM0677365.1 alpha/beta hydrolase [Micromonospora phytophila]